MQVMFQVINIYVYVHLYISNWSFFREIKFSLISISATVGNQQRFYIAGQGPLPHTVPHFWQASIILLVEQEFTSGLTGSQ